MPVRKCLLMLAVLALLGLMAGPAPAESIVLGGIEDHPGTTAFEGGGDFNDLIFSMLGNISVLAPSAQQLAFNSSVVNQAGTTFWDNNSLDGNDKNFGYCALQGGTCNGVDSTGVALNYVANAGGGAPVSELFQATGVITATLLVKVTSIANLDTLGWYDPSNPGVFHQIFAGSDSNGSVVTFTPSAIFALYSTNGVGDLYSSVTSGNVNDSSTQQHFALLDGVVPEPGTGGLAGAVLAAVWLGRVLRSKLRG
jgi:hypothetical protein